MTEYLIQTIKDQVLYFHESIQVIIPCNIELIIKKSMKYKQSEYKKHSAAFLFSLLFVLCTGREIELGLESIKIHL